MSASLGIFTCVYHFDDQLKFCQHWDRRRWRGPKEVYAAYDLCWTSSAACLIKYHVEGGRAIFLTQGFNPDAFRPSPGDFQFDVSFVGVAHGRRSFFIEALRRHGIEVATFGVGWRSGPVSFQDMIEIFRRPWINLGVASIAASKEAFTFKGREFDIPI